MRFPVYENGEAVFVAATYSLHYGEAAVREVIANLGMYGVFSGEKIAAYIGRHEEGSVGLLEVMPEFRRHGLGTYLVKYMAARVIEEGDIAYAQIVSDNEKSLNMHLKMGFVPSEKKVYWCY